jgi:hypothetical protein
MGIATFADYRTQIANPFNTLYVTKNSLATAAGLLSSLWIAAPFAGAAPGAPAVPTSATAGALVDWRPSGGGTVRLARVTLEVGSSARGTLVLCDRLSHQGGLSGTAITEQTTNLPTAALSRYTNGEGVMAGFEIYTIVGSTGRLVTASYTNQDGVSGRASLSMQIGATSHREAGRFIPMSLQVGDSGVRSVESVLLNASTGTVGNFGVTLYKPLAAFTVSLQTTSQDQLIGGHNIVDIHDDACLFWLFIPSGATSIGVLQATVTLIEDPV